METNKRRRSSRLRDLEADRGNDGASIIVEQRPSERNSKAKTRASSQSIGLRRTRSNSSSSSSESTATTTASVTTSKRRKRASASQSELSVAASTQAPTIASTTRRRTRSLSKHLQAKTVTPSPVSTTVTTKFSFASDDDNDESNTGIPSGVVNLYRDPEDELGRSSLAAFPSPPRKRARTRKAKKQHQLDQWSQRYARPVTLATAGGSVFDSSTPECLTIDYIRTYGEDYWRSLHEAERPIVCDPCLKEVRKDDTSPSAPDDSSNNRAKKNPFGSPTSGRSSSCSSSSTSTSKVTPEYAGDYMVRTKHLLHMSEREDSDPHLVSQNHKKLLAQPQLTPKMRSILVDWMIELSEHFDFGPSTLHLAVTMVDRVLASGPFGDKETEKKKRSRTICADHHSSDSANCWDRTESDSFYEDDSYCSVEEEEDEDDDDTRCYLIPRDKFQLLGVTCVWLACKIKEQKPPKAPQIAYVSDHIYSSGQITRMERRVCNALNFSFLQAPTPHQFLFEFMRASLAGLAPCSLNDEKDQSSTSSKVVIPASARGVGQAFQSVFRDMCHYLLELGRLPYGPSGKKPSLLAAAAVYLARITLGIPRALSLSMESEPPSSGASMMMCYWTPTLQHYTGYTPSDLKETVLEIHKYQMAAESSNLKAVFNKYKLPAYNRVALKTVVREEDLGFS